MKTTMQILRLSAGRIEDNGVLYANAITLDDSVSDLVTADRIDVGQQHAKVQMDTSDNNRLAHLLANSGLVPGDVEVTVKPMVKQGQTVLQIIGFSDKKVAA